jgi:RHH-type rel operon transcriptional repressor/antitoxin RelB
MEKRTSHTVTAKIPGVLNKRLESLTHTLDRKKGYLIRKAIAEYLDDNEDYLVALHRLETKGEVFSLEEIEKNCGLDV